MSVEDSIDDVERRRWDAYSAWLELGISMGWCSKMFCLTHDGPPLTNEEEEQLDEGLDPCISCVRLSGQP